MLLYIPQKMVISEWPSNFFNFCAFYLSQKLMWSVMLLMLLASLYILLEVHFHIYYKCCLIIFLLRSTVDDKGLCFSSHDNSREEYFWKQSVFPGCNPFIFSEIRRKKDGQWSSVFLVFILVLLIISWEKPQKCRKLG